MSKQRAKRDPYQFATHSLEENYQALATAIIRQAIVDGAGLWFFESDWYGLLTPWHDIPGKVIYEQVKLNRKNGYKNGLISERSEDERSENAGKE